MGEQLEWESVEWNSGKDPAHRHGGICPVGTALCVWNSWFAVCAEETHVGDRGGVCPARSHLTRQGRPSL
jgi:hypothetical protein